MQASLKTKASEDRDEWHGGDIVFCQRFSAAILQFELFSKADATDEMQADVWAWPILEPQPDRDGALRSHATLSLQGAFIIEPKTHKRHSAEMQGPSALVNLTHLGTEAAKNG